jgi:hypothetical protein
MTRAERLAECEREIKESRDDLKMHDRTIYEATRLRRAAARRLLVWPRNPPGEPHSGIDGQAYYGMRATDHPEFYKHGAPLLWVTHWMHLPEGPI